MGGETTGFADWAAQFVSAYGWQLFGVALSPLLAFRIGQWFKRTYKRLHGRKPHWLWMQVVPFSLTFLFSAFSFHQNHDDYKAVAFAAFAVACFYSATVEFIFRRAADHPALSAALRAEMYLEDPSRFERTVAFAVGAEIVRDRRQDENAPLPETLKDRRVRDA